MYLNLVVKKGSAESGVSALNKPPTSPSVNTVSPLVLNKWLRNKQWLAQVITIMGK